MWYPAKRKHSGFTLIELLVVVAIISLLVSILIPSLAKAKDLARTMMCQTNLKGIGLLAEMYRNDYKGYLPYMPRGMDTINTDAERKQTWQYRLMEYNDMASNVFDCPSDPRSNYMGSLYGPADYGVNAAYMEGVGGKMSPENPKRWGDPFLRAPEDILYVVDSECSFLYIWASCTWTLCDGSGKPKGSPTREYSTSCGMSANTVTQVFTWRRQCLSLMFITRKAS
ncbi:MAG: prepilin-type N-terminal cleavage/methylation domain-containing protein [Planctomycetes bacterium]|jgi:prepilin-type N-terminal cleavage/methylation domain-containing protein|nr:prepilin-type N-terminal cleavage/methylation domain-containing protein [Planctomycetota bacterium]